MFYHTNHKKRMSIHNLQAKFILIVTIVQKRDSFKYFKLCTIRRSATKKFNTGSSYELPVLKCFVAVENSFSTTFRQSMTEMFFSVF